MGAGKSTIGRKLSQKLNLGFLDLDKVIEEKSNQTIDEIFSQNGESEFRKYETKCLKEVVLEMAHVISLGGGTLLSEENRRLVKESGRLIYLKASVEELVKRARPKAHLRPLLKGKSESEIREFIIHLFKSRETIYDSAEIIILTDNISSDEVVGKVISKL